VNGVNGATGPAGADGVNGVNGTDGPAGATGMAGADGATGADGAAGPAGADGVNGADGATGDTETRFTQHTEALGVLSLGLGLLGTHNRNALSDLSLGLGLMGTHNRTALGDLGLGLGLVGVTIETLQTNAASNTERILTLEEEGGPAGPAGPAGADGAPGVNGADGVNGTDGTDGADGVNGTDGVNGAAGLRGPLGAPGATSATGSRGPLGAPGATGATGSRGPAGADAETDPALEEYVGAIDARVGENSAAITILQGSHVTENLALYFDPSIAESYTGGTTLFDLSGNGRDCTLEGGAAVTDGDVALNGSSQYIFTTYMPNLDNFREYTFELWLNYTSSSSSVSSLISNYGVSRNGHYSQTFIDSEGIWVRERNSSGVLKTTSGQSFVVGEWVHIISSATATHLLLYVNGIQVGSVGRPGGVVTSNDTISIGGNFLDMYQMCRIGPVRIYYDKALTSAEVMQNYNAKNTDNTGSDPALEAYVGAIDARVGENSEAIVSIENKLFITSDAIFLTPTRLWLSTLHKLTLHLRA